MACLASGSAFARGVGEEDDVQQGAESSAEGQEDHRAPEAFDKDVAVERRGARRGQNERNEPYEACRCEKPYSPEEQEPADKARAQRRQIELR